MNIGKLNYVQKKLLKKVRVTTSDNLREIEILRRYHITKRSDYVKYNRMCGHIKKLVNRLIKLDSDDQFRIKTTELLLQKVYDMGLINTTSSLNSVHKITASSFCRRRLPVVMVRIKLVENIEEAITFIEQGHVRIGPETVVDPAFLVTRSLEDNIKWNNGKIVKAIRKYNDKLDDYELLGN